jgi:hypothetical protein
MKRVALCQQSRMPDYNARGTLRVLMSLNPHGVRQMKILGAVATLFDTSWRRLLRKPRRRPGW